MCDTMLIEILHRAQQVVAEALEQRKIEWAFTLDPSGEGFLAGGLHGKADQIVEIEEIERLYDLPELEFFELFQDLEFVDEPLVVFGIASDLKDLLFFAERDKINDRDRAGTEALLDDKSASQTVAFDRFQRVRFLFFLRTGEFLLNKI